MRVFNAAIKKPSNEGIRKTEKTLYFCSVNLE